MTNYNKLLAEYPGADGMKTGFICSSGFNLVASATRDNRRLIAIVLGAPSSAWRAQKAASMLEQGFSSGAGLGWLLPSLGTVDKLQPINAAPPDLHEQICGPHHKRPRAENEDDEASTSGDTDQQRAMMLSDLKGATKTSLLTGNPLAAVPPIVVFTGARKPSGSGEAEANAATIKPAKKKQAKGDKAKGDQTKTADAKTDKTEAAKSAKPSAPKTAQAKSAKPKAAPTAQ
jgi:D-alanyl-D-alanine carboxypeptidase